MNIAEIKRAVDDGLRVHWKNPGYVVTKDECGQYHITFVPNGNRIGLTNKAGDQLNGQEDDFFVSALTGSARRGQHGGIA